MDSILSFEMFGSIIIIQYMVFTEYFFSNFYVSSVRLNTCVSVVYVKLLMGQQ